MAYCRIDHGQELIHFTRDAEDWDYNKSYQRFYEIVQEGILRASSTDRLGSITSLCFTESPYTCLTDGAKLNKKYFSRYSPFGFQFSKDYIYEEGGLPVIYSPKKQFDIDNTDTNWRTVSYDPIGLHGGYRDFSWEREWRIKPDNDEFKINRDKVKLIFPSDDWAKKFRDDHDEFHRDGKCNCKCIREAKLIEYDRYHSREQYGELKGTCPNPAKFPWVLLSMNCNNVPKP